MRAVVYKKNKKTLEYVNDFPKPKLESGQVLIKVLTCGFCGSDHSMIESGLAPDNYIFGHEFTGIIEEYAQDVENPKLKIGSRVNVRPSFCGVCSSCVSGKFNICLGKRRSTGIGDLNGAFAEYVVAYPNMLIAVPDNISDENAALAEMFASAYHGIDKIPNAYKKAIVFGAGPIGLATVQILRSKAYENIIVSEPVAAKRDLALKFGATKVIDPFSQKLNEEIKLGEVNVAFECAGIPKNINEAIEILTPGGYICLLGLNMHKPIAEMNTFNFNLKELTIISSMSNLHSDNYSCLQLLKAKLLDAKPIISDVISLDQLPETYSQKIHTGKTMKVLVKI